MRNLTDLLGSLPLSYHIEGPADIPISHITADTRQVQPGSLFVAWKGKTQDGHRFIPEAIAKGAHAVVYQEPIDFPQSFTRIRVDDSRAAYGHLCRAWFDFPDRGMRLIGITGTNGKSSTAYYIYQIWRGLGRAAGLIGTVFCLAGDEKLPATLTTPDSYELYRLLARFRQKGITHTVMEVSSIALDQHRTAGLSFDGAIFTNLTHDHLDYHGTFLHYRDSKKRLFDGLSPRSFALTNKDDKHGAFMLQNTAASSYYYTLESVGDFYMRLEEVSLHGLSYRLGKAGTPESPSLHAALVGRFQAYNLLAAVAAVYLIEQQEAVWENLFSLSTRLIPLPGRMEPVLLPEDKIGIVDYAHTPDAVENVLRTLRGLVSRGELIAVLGAGGDRDRTKRAPMASAAIRYADRVILTSDNPRSEDPQQILSDMEQGIPASHRHRFLRITDRAEAIRTAVLMAPPHSIIAVLGKGHETYQEIQGVRYPFSDRDVLLSQVGGAHAG
ncbi:MAG: UDP-N-acetylmuramoyl-L-alanyl-D-glutamate--2,6-diaminopimelate ligase [Bacteroidia bacterium]|nr:UDP-N-acetylmuramoyl-L-alanyl-D-glutamate--2,6-diaminopimelate ligase [Bacteroidia bacterium]MDW8235603.1 UDP-N-acetylmuramoyl-L-alanyl-D-glutamate--2,6-diaminopimelate ligase [Bacteroidia bacterium]